jgi:hypothetical protein
LATTQHFGRWLLVSCDAVGYGSGDDLRHKSVQTALPAVLDEAAARARLHRVGWRREVTGDGELALLPDTEPEPRVVDDYVNHLNGALTAYNRDLRQEARLRLRVAIHYGVAVRADNGYAGQGVVVVSRLVDARPVRAALEVSDADLAVILSDQVFTDTVAQYYTSVRPEAFRRVRVENKEFLEDAWLWVPDRDVHGMHLGQPDDPPAESMPA